MWTGKEEQSGRARNPAELVVMESGTLAAAMPTPSVANLNVTKSSKVHIGPKFVSVTQNVQNADTLKELPLPKYLWHIIKNSSRTERLSCAAALVVLIVCVGLIGYFSTRNSQTEDSVDRAPHEWNVTREMWLAEPHNYTFFTYKYEPLMLVIIQNTVGPQCHRFSSCAAELRNLQGWYLKDLGYDIPYNFAIGNDGRVYENRGWGVEGAHTFGFNGCSIGLGFLGDYREEMPNHASLTAAQVNHTFLLLEEGVRRGHLRRDFLVVGARDLTSTASPGSNLYNAIRLWHNYDHQARFKGLTCAQIHQKYADVPLRDVDAF